MSAITENLIEIQNRTGSALTYKGTSYANNAYIPLSRQVSYKVQYAKLWSSDTGRSMTGENKGTLVGIFPKITIAVGTTSAEDFACLSSLLNQDRTNIKYYDTQYQQVKTNSFYFADLTDELKRKSTGEHKGFECNAIANVKR